MLHETPQQVLGLRMGLLELRLGLNHRHSLRPA